MRNPRHHASWSRAPAPSARARGRRAARARGLSLIEMMIALTISAMLLTATLAALDSMFKGYKQTTESASTHVVSRIVMTRLLGMIRTGTDFAPLPPSVLDSNKNPIAADYLQFVGKRDDDGNPLDLIRIEFRYPGQNAALRSWGVAEGPPAPAPGAEPPAGPGELWYVRLDSSTTPATIIESHPLLSGVRSAIFTLEYDIGPKLVRGTVDMTIEPNDSRDLTIGAEEVAQTIRLVASAAPRIDAE